MPHPSRVAASVALILAAAAAPAAVPSPAVAPATAPGAAPATASPSPDPTPSPAPSPSPPPRPTVRVDRLDLSALPQLAQPGAGTAPADDAYAVLQVRTTPAVPGVPVTVLVRGDDGWARHAEAETGPGGAAQVRVRATRGDRPALYRAVAAGTRSNDAGPGRWGAPVFSEEFDSDSLSARWSHRGLEHSPESMRACSKGSPEAASVSRGALRLAVLRDRSRTDKCPALLKGEPRGPFAYRLNGHVSTEDSFTFTYGIAAARLKFQPDPGQHASFWLQPKSPPLPGGYEPRFTGAEIDVIEWFGRGNPSGGLTQFTYHRDSTGNRIKTGGFLHRPDRFLDGPDDSWFERYHVFSVEWTPSEYVFRIDGQETWRSDVGISHRPQFLILSLLSSDYEVAKAGDEGLGTQSMAVDWVRVWQQ